MINRTPQPTFPKRWVRYLVDKTLLLRGTKLPAFFNLQHRLLYLFYGLEPSVVRVVRRFLGPGDTVVDVGANVGYLSRQFALMVGKNGKVYSFEPDPAMFGFLDFNTGTLPQVVRLQAALSDQTGHSELYLHPTSAMSNSLVNIWEDAQPIKVRTATFDSWASDTKVGPVHLVKIDVEGAEPLVLRGMQEALKKAHKPMVILEFSPANLGKRSAEQEIFDTFHDSGFSIEHIDRKGGLHRIHEPADAYGRLNENGYVNLLASHVGN